MTSKHKFKLKFSDLCDRYAILQTEDGGRVCDRLSLHENARRASCDREEHNTINLEAFRNNEYPIVRRLFLVTRQDNSVDKQAGVAYYTLLLTDERQQLVQEVGFIPIR